LFADSGHRGFGIHGQRWFNPAPVLLFRRSNRRAAGRPYMIPFGGWRFPARLFPDHQHRTHVEQRALFAPASPIPSPTALPPDRASAACRRSSARHFYHAARSPHRKSGALADRLQRQLPDAGWWRGLRRHARL
jgi:hypothetical protein